MKKKTIRQSDLKKGKTTERRSKRNQSVDDKSASIELIIEFRNLSKFTWNLIQSHNSQPPWLTWPVKVLTPSRIAWIDRVRAYWQNYLKFARRLIVPWQSLANGDSIFYVSIAFLLSSIETIGLLVSLLYLSALTNTLPPIPKASPPGGPDLIFLLVLFIIFLFLIPAIYQYLFDLFTDWKIISALRAFLALVYPVALLGAVTFPAFPIWLPILHERSTAMIDLLVFYFGDWKRVSIFALVLFIGLIPSLAYFHGFLIDTASYLWRLLNVFSRHILTFHEPVRTVYAEKLLASKVVAAGPSGKRQKLTELNTNQLLSLQELASANQEGTNKRLTLTFIALAILTLFGQQTNDLIGFLWGYIYNALANGSHTSPLMQVIQGGGIGIVLSVIALPVNAITVLFANVWTQGVIIEACIAAKYSKRLGRSRSRKSK